MKNYTSDENILLEMGELNNSIAGSRLADVGVSCAADWGIIPAKSSEFSDVNTSSTQSGETSDRESDSNSDAAARIAYAKENMPAVKAFTDFVKDDVFAGLKLAVALIIEPKTAVLVLALKELGADVTLYCSASSTDDSIAEELRKRGVKVYANSRNSASDDETQALRMLDDSPPELMLDDGAHLARLLYLQRPDLLKGLFGISEETTSGVRAFEQMKQNGDLRTPVLAVNNSFVKTFFDNRHGTGETVVLAILKVTKRSFSGKKVHIAGYGPVGEGIAKRIRALGAKVTVSEAKSTAALRASFDGFNVVKLQNAVQNGADVIISASGFRHTITATDLQLAKDGAIFAVAGGTPNEIALDDIAQLDMVKIDASNIDETKLVFPDNTITILSGGHGINYTSAGGNPIEIMDLSFAAQLESLYYLIQNKGNLEPKIYELSAQTDEKVANSVLSARNIRIEDITLIDDWRETRFNDKEVI